MNEVITYIILFDVEKHDRVNQAEYIQNVSYKIYHPSNCETGAIPKVRQSVLYNMNDEIDDDFIVIPISDFMNEINNQIFDMDKFWFTYVSVELVTELTFKDYANELNKLCDRLRHVRFNNSDKLSAWDYYVKAVESMPTRPNDWILNAYSKLTINER